MSEVVYKGWMLRIGCSIGRRKIDLSFIHTFFFPFLVCLFPMDFAHNHSSIPKRFFVLKTSVKTSVRTSFLACYKRKSQGNMVLKKTLFIDGNCRVEYRGRMLYRGNMVYVLCVYNEKDKNARIMMAALKIREALIWKVKIESVINQVYQDLNTANGSMLHDSFGINADGNASSSNRERLASAEDEEVTNHTMIRRTTIGNGLREWVSQTDETHTVPNIPVMMSISSGSVSSKKGGESHDNFYHSIPLDEESDEYEDCFQEPEEMMDSFKAENAMKQPGSVSSKKGGDSHDNFNQSIPSDEESDEYEDCLQEPAEMMDSFKAENAMKQPGSVSSKKGGESHDNFNQSILLDEESDEYQDRQIQEPEEMMDSVKAENAMKQPDEDPLDQLDLSSFSGNLRRDDRDNIRNCWGMLDGNNFKVRSKTFCYDKTKIPAGKPFMKLVAVDWFKDVKRMDHVARRQGCAVQAASEKGLFTLVINVQVQRSTHYSMVFYFVSKPLVSGSLLQHFVDGDDEFRNSRFKLIPSVPKKFWMNFLPVGPCLLGKAVDCTYIREPKYMEIDIDLGSTVAKGVLGVLGNAFGLITTSVVVMAFLIQANTYEELPERLIGAVRVSWLEPSSAIDPQLEPNTSTE